MALKDIWNQIAGKPPSDKPEEKPKPPEQKPAAKPEVVLSDAERKKQAAKDRVETPGPAERFIVQNPEVLKKALDAKAERESPKPTKNEHQPPSQPKPGPMIQTPAGLAGCAPNISAEASASGRSDTTSKSDECGQDAGQGEERSASKAAP